MKKTENARMSIFRPCNNRVFCVRIFADMKEKERYDLKGKRDLNVSSLWQDDEEKMTRTIFVLRSKMNSIGQSLTILTSPEIFGLS